jgi:hypothetical protein
MHTTVELRGLLAVLALAATAPTRAAEAATTVTGWFSDELCARSRVSAGIVGPNNRDCVQKCLDKGAAMVFVDEKAKRVLRVANPEAARGQESHHVSVTGSVDGDTLRVAAVEVLESYVAACTRPRAKK